MLWLQWLRGEQGLKGGKLMFGPWVRHSYLVVSILVKGLIFQQESHGDGATLGFGNVINRSRHGLRAVDLAEKFKAADDQRLRSCKRWTGMNPIRTWQCGLCCYCHKQGIGGGGSINSMASGNISRSRWMSSAMIGAEPFHKARATLIIALLSHDDTEVTIIIWTLGHNPRSPLSANLQLRVIVMDHQIDPIDTVVGGLQHPIPHEKPTKHVHVVCNCSFDDERLRELPMYILGSPRSPYLGIFIRWAMEYAVILAR